MSGRIKNPPVNEVNSVAEYMEYIRQYQLNSCISRGEDRQYPLLNAAAFRRNSNLEIQKMVSAFEQRIGNSLTEMQRRHFLAFSQHHGLPTNLLDFTFSVDFLVFCLWRRSKGEWLCLFYPQRQADRHFGSSGTD